jgi:hypothetical protein
MPKNEDEPPLDRPIVTDLAPDPEDIERVVLVTRKLFIEAYNRALWVKHGETFSQNIMKELGL